MDGIAAAAGVPSDRITLQDSEQYSVAMDTPFKLKRGLSFFTVQILIQRLPCLVYSITHSGPNTLCFAHNLLSMIQLGILLHSSSLLAGLIHIQQHMTD